MSAHVAKRKISAARGNRFATELWDQPDRVVTKLGGWKEPRTLELYQQPGEDAMLQALEGRKELRQMAQGG